MDVHFVLFSYSCHFPCHLEEITFHACKIPVNALKKLQNSLKKMTILHSSVSQLDLSDFIHLKKLEFFLSFQNKICCN